MSEQEPQEKPLGEYNTTMLRWKLTINQCHLSDVLDARAALDKEWDTLQAERDEIIDEISRRGPSE